MTAALATATASASSTPRSRLRGATAELVFVGRSLRHSIRDGESLLMAIMLPVIIMLMFTWVFGGAIFPGGGYVDYVVPGVILICAGFGASDRGILTHRAARSRQNIWLHRHRRVGRRPVPRRADPR